MHFRSAWLRPATAVAAAVSLLLPARGGSQPSRAPEEYRLLPVRVHLLRSRAVPELHCRLRAADVRRVLAKVNRIWRPAGLQFYPESILSETAANAEFYRAFGENRTEAHLRLVRPRASRSDRMFHLYFLGEMRPNGICLDASYELIFVKETAVLDPVPGGIDEALPRVAAHEIGHGLGLEHRQDRLNLMASGTTGTSLSEAEIRAARETAGGLPWAMRPDQALETADRLAAEGRRSAPDLYAVLAGLPDGEVSAAARRRLDE